MVLCRHERASSSCIRNARCGQRCDIFIQGTDCQYAASLRTSTRHSCLLPRYKFQSVHSRQAGKTPGQANATSIKRSRFNHGQFHHRHNTKSKRRFHLRRSYKTHTRTSAHTQSQTRQQRRLSPRDNGIALDMAIDCRAMHRRLVNHNSNEAKRAQAAHGNLGSQRSRTRPTMRTFHILLADG